MKSARKAVFAIETLGCKLNQFDSALIEGALIKRNHLSSDDYKNASVVIINTCTVTNSADYQSRQLIRRVRRENPSAKIIVTGCSARLDPEKLRGLHEADIVIDACDEKAARAVVSEIEEDGKAEREDPPFSESLLELHYTGRTRAFLKIQDGCDLQCSYCVIPKVRGRSRSIEPEIVLRNVRQLTEKGYREIVLTGINSGEYGKDLSPRTSLFQLLKQILLAEDLGRVRLNSLEPPTIDDDLIDLIASTNKIAHHVHIPLQSGCDTILAKMRRPYRTKEYLELIEKLRRKIPDIGIGTDVIVGFPGETEDDFRQTYDFIRNSPVNFLHVFPFSKRPGTIASSLKNEVNGRIIRERSSRLRVLGKQLSLHFRESNQGKILDVIVLEEKRDDGLYRSLSGNYIEMGISAGMEEVNTVCPAKVTAVLPDDTIGEILRSS